MVIQVFEERRKPTVGQKLAGGFERALTMADQFRQEEEAKKMQSRERKAGSDYLQTIGIPDVSNLPLDFQKKILEEHSSADRERIKGGYRNMQEQKSPQEMKAQEDAYNVIKEQFGDQAADLFQSLPVGGQTEFVKHLLDSRARGQNIFDKVSQEDGAEEKPPMKTIDYDKGLNPKERAARQDKRYGINLPLYESNQEKTYALEHEADSLEVMAELSPKISGWERLNINPQTGSLIIPALASADAQRFAKTVNDFTVNAKDSFGARVSNFELDRFMQRLPTLANSAEGRSEIIRAMQLINKMNLARNKELSKVFEEHGGIRNIDYDAAQRIAEKNISKQLSEYKSEFRKVNSNMDNQYKKVVDKKKKDLVPSGRVMVEKDGKQFSVPKKQIQKAIEKGYKVI